MCWLEDSMTKQHVYDQGHPSNDSDEKKKRKWDTWISGYRSTFEPITDRILFTVKHHASLHSSSTNTISWCSPYVITWQYVQSIILRRLKVIMWWNIQNFPIFDFINVIFCNILNKSFWFTYFFIEIGRDISRT